MGSQAHELSIFPGSWKGSTFHCSPLVIRWLLAYWLLGCPGFSSFALLLTILLNCHGIRFKSLYFFENEWWHIASLNWHISWVGCWQFWFSIFLGGNINLHFVSHLLVALQMHKHTLNASEWESDSSQWIRHFSFYMMCWGICFSNATSRLQISRNWLLLDHFPFNLGSPSETKTHQPIP